MRDRIRAGPSVPYSVRCDQQCRRSGGLTTLASAVEFVEALTIVLAMGLDPRLALGAGRHRRRAGRRWRASRPSPATRSSVAPRGLLQLVVGTLLLIFGLQWLRKAILRAAGLKALHDEDATFREEVEAARGAPARARLGPRLVRLRRRLQGRVAGGPRGRLHRHHLRPQRRRRSRSAALGAAAGGVIVLAAGVALHRPLARVPENTIKFAVGLLLTTFGTFWAVEGLGVVRARRESLSGPAATLALLGAARRLVRAPGRRSGCWRRAAARGEVAW